MVRFIKLNLYNGWVGIKSMKNLRKWFENYWYHYKWRTLIVAFFAIIIVVCMVQMMQKK